MSTLAIDSPVLVGIHVFDGVLSNPHAYRTSAVARSFGDVTIGNQVFRGIAPVVDETLSRAIAAGWRSDARTTLSFFRKSPKGQQEPTYIHSDAEMGQWTAILYLNPDLPAGDGTSFWRDRATDTIRGEFDAQAAQHRPRWERWHHVEARFNRLLIFESDLFHSRGLVENFGEGDDARLVQVAFGALQKPAAVVREATMRDVPAIVDMADRFVASTSYRGFLALDREKVAGLAARLIASADAVFFIAERGSMPIGMLAMHAFDHPMSGERVAAEIVWWMEPEARGTGVRLLKAAEQWARNTAATVISMVAPTAQVGELYKRLAYAPVEVSWQKRI